jgi:2-desacetyl-2-hydroxyethyl bacteriochlorophyllide A dehydrogenase
MHSSLNIVFTAPNRVEMQTQPMRALRPGEVLCGAERSLISIGTEMLCLRGEFEPGTNWAGWVRYPFHPGYSMAARVLAVGDGVSAFREGDRIAASASHCQLFTLPAAECYKLPDGVSDDDATWTTLACTTQLAVRRAALQLGESVGVIGLGMLGQLVVQYLHVAGARRIVAIDTSATRLQLAAAHGATHTLQLGVAEARAGVAEITGGGMLDAVFDVTGHPAVLAPAVGLLRRMGRVVLLGDTVTPSLQYLGPGVVSNSISVLGIHGSAHPEHASEFAPWSRREMAALFYDFLLQGRMCVSGLETHRHAPKEAPEVYAGLARDRSAAMGVLFDWRMER